MQRSTASIKPRYTRHPTHRLTELALVILVACMACGESTTPVGPLDAGDAGEGGVDLDSGPAPVADGEAGFEPLAAGSYAFPLMVDGRSRRYFLYVSERVDRSMPAPVVLNLHGGGGSGPGQLYTTMMDETADRHGFLLVHPEGIPTEGTSDAHPFATWNVGGCCGTAAAEDVDDVEYIRQLLVHLAERVRVDQARVYATGISNGGMMSYRLACEASEIIAAVAPVAAPAIETPACTASRAVPVLHIHGTEDPCAYYEGSDACGACFQNYLNSLLGTSTEPIGWACGAIEPYVGAWRARQSCPADPEATVESGESTRCATWRPCEGESEITLCTVEGMGHTWPSGRHIPACERPRSRACRLWIETVGAISYDLSNEDIWSFLSRHRLP